MPASEPVPNTEVARLLDEIGDLLDLEEGNPFHVRAYKRAAQRVRQLDGDVATAFTASSLPLDGAPLADEIEKTVRDLSESGTSPRLEELLGRLPRSLRDLSGVPGLDPKRAVALREALGVETLDDLEKAAQAGRIHEVRGFGEKSERAILESLRRRARERRRFLLDRAHRRAVELCEWLQGSGHAREVEAAGDLRRQVPHVGGIELVATAGDPLAAVARLLGHPDVEETLTRSRTRATVRLKSGLKVELHLVKPEGRGAALLHLTGSKAHLDGLRRRATELGYDLNTFGLFDAQGSRIAGATEADVYAALSLAWIPPELREGTEVIEAAATGQLPSLLEPREVRGDLHVVVDPLDQVRTDALVQHLAQRGAEYAALVIPATRGVLGFDDDLFARRLDAARALRGRSPFPFLIGIDVEILDDGSLAAPEHALTAVDLVFASARTRFDLPRAQQTERLLRALANPLLDVLARPRGRLLGRSEGLRFDLERVLREAKRRRVAVEVNAQPDRLDLDGDACRVAKAIGVDLVLGTEATVPEDLALLELAVGQARRGGLSASDVWNARPLSDLPLRRGG